MTDGEMSTIHLVAATYKDDVSEMDILCWEKDDYWDMIHFNEDDP